MSRKTAGTLDERKVEVNIPGELMLAIFAVVGLIVVAIGLAVINRFIWPHVKGTAKAILTLVLVGGLVLAAITAAGWLSDPFNWARVQNTGSSTMAFAKAWWLMNVGELPSFSLPGSQAQQPKPAAPKVQVDMSALNSKLEPIPVEVRSYQLKQLPKFQTSTQKVVDQKDVVVAVNGVISPTLSTRRTTNTTIGSSSVITDGLSARVPVTGTVTVLIYQDGTIRITERSFGEIMQGWLGQVQRISKSVLELDEQPEPTRKVAKDAQIRRDLRDTMVQIATLFDFQPELFQMVGVTKANPIMDDIKNWKTVEAQTSRIRLAVFQAQSCNVTQAPRDKDEGGTPALRGLVDCVRTKYHALDARTAELIWTRDPAKTKQDTPGWKELQKEVLKALSELNDTIDKLDTEVEAQGLDSGNRADYEKVYDLKLVDLLLDAERNLMALKTTLEAP